MNYKAETGRTRVVFFLPTLECGGTERNTVNLLKSLSREQYALSLLLAERKGDFIKDIPADVLIESFETPRLRHLFFKLVDYFKQEKADVFVSAFPRFNAVVLLAKWIAGGKTKVVVTEHLSFSLLSKNAKTPSHRFIARFLFPYFIRFFYPSANSIICVSRGIADEISLMMGHGKNVRVIYNPVADDSIAQKAQENPGHPWFADTAIPVIVMVARLSKTKDQPTLFEALEIIRTKQPARLMIIGDGSERQKLENLVSQLGLSGSIALLGYQDNPYRYMKRASVFVLSSLQEGFGNVIVEAMACGAPVVATDCPSGPAEIIQEGQNGLLVPAQNAKALAAAIIKILNDPALARKFSEEGKKRAQFFSVKNSVEQYSQIFQAIIH